MNRFRHAPRGTTAQLTAIEEAVEIAEKYAGAGQWKARREMILSNIKQLESRLECGLILTEHRERAARTIANLRGQL